MSDVDTIVDADRTARTGALYQSGALPDVYGRCTSLDVTLLIDAVQFDVLGQPAAGAFLFTWWPIDDAPYLPNLDHLRNVGELGARHMQHGGSCWSHCGAGINRASLINGQILHALHPDWSGQQIIEQIRGRRAGALSNQVFTEYLAGLHP